MPAAPFFLQLIEQAWNPSIDATSIHQNIPPILLWLLIAVTYLVISMLLSMRILHTEEHRNIWWTSTLGLVLGSTAFLFKLASTAEHSPELLAFASPTVHENLLHVDSVTIARILFTGLVSTMGYVLLVSGNMKQQGTKTDL